MITTEEIVKRLKNVFGNEYDYSKVEYLNAKTKVCVVCPKHGEFLALVANLMQGKGCPKCGYEKSSLKQSKDLDYYKNKVFEIHGDKYDLSLITEYKGYKTKNKVICKKHGVFLASFDSLVNKKNGCPMCSGNKKYSFEDFIFKANNKHNSKYQYVKSTFNGMRKKMTIICPIHGEFEQTPHDHIMGQGCPKCGRERTICSKKSNTEEFISKLNKLTNNYYDTSKVNYVNSITKVCLICPKHGEFWIRPNDVLNGQSCPYCGKIRQKEMAKKRLRFTTKEFIEECQRLFPDLYDFDKTEFNGMSKKCIITCKKHGDFEITPNNLLKGHGCAKCAFEENSKKRITKWNDVLSMFKEKHVDKYTYDETTYVNKKQKMRMFCQKHGEFWQSPENHILGHGCPICKESKLELEVANKLEELEIDYVRQKKIGRQFLDFYLPEYNIAIECQGEQHFKQKLFTNTFEDLKTNIERDIRKNKKVKEMNIKLLYYSNSSLLPKNINDNIFNGIYENGIILKIEELIDKIKKE